MANKEQKRIAHKGRDIYGRRLKFFRVELTDSDCNILLTNPDLTAYSLEKEFYPSVFIQFIHNGLGTRFALMKW